MHDVYCIECIKPKVQYHLCSLVFFYSPHQDDFVVLHVTNEYDTVFESVFKTEFLTLLSEKYTAQTRKTLVVSFGKR